ncbi:MAG: lumazine-binding protein [Mycobacteriaceae bacterium]
MAEAGEDRSSPAPILIALSVVGMLLIAMVVLRLVRGDQVPDDAAVGRAAVGQNDALQRGDYTDFQRYTCAAEQGTENRLLADQRESTRVKGARYVDDVTDVTVAGERATATVVYHFEKASDDKVSAAMTFTRENGDWKVCSPGPR